METELAARGMKKIIQILTKPKLNKKGQVVKEGKKYFCESMEEKEIFFQNNPGVEIEIYPVELPISVADRYVKGSKKHFTRKEEKDKTLLPTHTEMCESETPTVDLSDLTVEEPMWRHQAARLGIPYKGRTKEDVLAEIEKATTVSTA